jgi:hypothetical protein
VKGHGGEGTLARELAIFCRTVFLANDTDVPERFHNAAHGTSAILCYSGFRIHTLMFLPPNSINSAPSEHLRVCYFQYGQTEEAAFSGSCGTYGTGVRVVWLMGGDVSEEHEVSISAAKMQAAGCSETSAQSSYHTTYHVPHGTKLHGHRCTSLESDTFTACYYNHIRTKVKLSLCTP